MTLLPLSIHWSQHILYMSGKQNSKLLYRLPPQGKRRESINVYISFVPVTKEKEQEIDRLILKAIMKN